MCDLVNMHARTDTMCACCLGLLLFVQDEPIMSKWLLTRYLLTGLYVGFATVGVAVHWYLDHGVTWSQLLNWSTCIVSET